jgi:hypothetical protein
VSRSRAIHDRRSLPLALGSPVVLALRREDAARACGVSEETFDKHVRPSLPVVRLGTVRTYPVMALQRWLLEHAAAPTDEVAPS